MTRSKGLLWPAAQTICGRSNSTAMADITGQWPAPSICYGRHHRPLARFASETSVPESTVDESVSAAVAAATAAVEEEPVSISGSTVAAADANTIVQRQRVASAAHKLSSNPVWNEHIVCCFNN